MIDYQELISDAVMCNNYSLVDTLVRKFRYIEMIQINNFSDDILKVFVNNGLIPRNVFMNKIRVLTKDMLVGNWVNDQTIIKKILCNGDKGCKKRLKKVIKKYPRLMLMSLHSVGDISNIDLCISVGLSRDLVNRSDMTDVIKSNNPEYVKSMVERIESETYHRPKIMACHFLAAVYIENIDIFKYLQTIGDKDLEIPDDYIKIIIQKNNCEFIEYLLESWTPGNIQDIFGYVYKYADSEMFKVFLGHYPDLWDKNLNKKVYEYATRNEFNFAMIYDYLSIDDKTLIVSFYSQEMYHRLDILKFILKMTGQRIYMKVEYVSSLYNFAEFVEWTPKNISNALKDVDVLEYLLSTEHKEETIKQIRENENYHAGDNLRLWSLISRIRDIDTSKIRYTTILSSETCIFLNMGHRISTMSDAILYKYFYLLEIGQEVYIKNEQIIRGILSKKRVYDYPRDMVFCFDFDSDGL